MRWTTATAGDFDFGLPVPAGGAASPAHLVSASQIFRAGNLLPCETAGCSQQDGHIPVARPAVARLSPLSSPLFHSTQSTPLSLRACSNKQQSTRCCGAAAPLVATVEGAARFVRFVMPYSKARRRRRGATRVVAGEPVSRVLFKKSTYLDENKQLILAILDNQNNGEVEECARDCVLLEHCTRDGMLQCFM
ncbi:hypothetical protein ZWY2020_004640 [Hordeum vulgare]|nr:hypothetical protein ZWY2020_004640 [Hordeum vulgare]